MKAGTTVTCPACDAPQIRSTKDINSGQQIKDGCWETLGFDMDSAHMNCVACHELWTRQHPKTLEDQIHTDNGWVSLAKTNAPVKKKILQ